MRDDSELGVKIRKARSYRDQGYLKLTDAIQRYCLEFGEYQLSSGAISNYYLDLRPLALSSSGLFWIVYCLHDVLQVEGAGRSIKTEFDAIGGPCIGADPIVGAFLYNQGRVKVPVRGFLVRKEEKTYGKKSMVIGSVKPGDKVVVVEDVCSTGTSLLRACQLIKEHGCEVVQAICVVDRLAGAETLFNACGIPYKSILTINDLGINDDTTTTEPDQNNQQVDSGPPKENCEAVGGSCRVSDGNEKTNSTSGESPKDQSGDVGSAKVVE